MTVDKKGLAWLLDVRFLALLAGLLCFLVYLPALENGFVSWDDDVYLYNNDHIRHLNGEFFRWAFTEFRASNWHPLTWISHALDYAVWGLNPFGHHLTSVLLHCCNTLMVVLLTHQLLASISKVEGSFLSNRVNLTLIALVSGLLFGLHPLHVESVAWVSERKDLLSSFFYLLSLLFYLRTWRDSPGAAKIDGINRNSNYLACLALFTFALMSKPMAISLPFVLLLIDWLHVKSADRKAWTHLLVTKAPFFLLALISAVVTVAAQKTAGTMSSLTTAPLDDRLWVAGHALVAYLQKMVWPVDLQPFYIYPPSVKWFSLQYLGSALLVVAVSVAACWGAYRKRGLAVAWAYYVVTLVPVLGIVKVGSQAMADRYTYLPSIAPFIVLATALVWILQRFSWQKFPALKSGMAALLIAALLFAILAPITHKQIHIWESGETLWRYQIQHNDGVPLAYKQLGVALFEREEYAEAAVMMSKALSLKPQNTDLLSNLAICHLELGNLDKAMQAVESALRIEGHNPRALNTLGEIYLARQQYPEANTAFYKAMQMEPEKPLRIFNLAVSFDKLEDTGQACTFWRRFMAVDVSEDYDAEIITHLADIGCPLN